MKVGFVIVFLILWTSFLGQNLVFDSTFNRLGEFYQTDGLYLQWHEGVFSRGGVLPLKHAAYHSAAFQFRVSSVKVDPNFIVAKLTEELQAGMIYEIQLEVQKDHFSPLSIREIQLYFGSSINTSTTFLHGAAREQLIGVSLDSVSSKEFHIINAAYTAQGGEEFVYLGSLDQRFSIGETARLGLLMADRSYDELPSNCTYYVRSISIRKMSDKGKKIDLSLEDNWYNLKSGQRNLVINGGAEADLFKRYYTNETTFKSTGSLIAPFVYSLNEHCLQVDQLDSNDYRSVYDVNQLCYMGDGQFIIDVLKTNFYHQYGEVIWRDEGKEYDTHHIYERTVTANTQPYAYGEYLVLPLKEPLVSGKSYHWSSMIKISETGCYGVDYLGVHFLDEFPQNIFDTLWQRSPEKVLELGFLTSTQAWSEFNLNYQARGGERFIALGHLPVINGVKRNETFKRQFDTDCGPNEYNCLDRYVFYKDSLFARYQVDNIFLAEETQQNYNSAIFPPGKRVQMEIIFTCMSKSSVNDSHLDIVKSALINAQQVLRIEDAICIVDQRKKDPVILDPNPIINKKRILRKIDKPKPSKKVKNRVLPPELVLFGEGVDDVNINHLILVMDENGDLSNVQHKLNKFTNNGGTLTIYYVGSAEKWNDFQNTLSSLENVNLLDSRDISSRTMVEILLRN